MVAGGLALDIRRRLSDLRRCLHPAADRDPRSGDAGQYPRPTARGWGRGGTVGAGVGG